MMLTYILLAVHIFFCFKTHFVQRHTLRGIRYSLRPSSGGTYAAFAAALGTTVGPGNIVGVAVAISTGGAGAVFWMWLCGILAMGTKYAESYLCLKYRDDTCGGPMVLLKREGFKGMSAIWSVLCVAAGLLMGAAVPSRSLADTVACPSWVCGAVLALLTLVTVSFGVSGISRVSSYLVPVMSLGFILLCFISLDYSTLGDTLSIIVKDAFSLNSAVGGGIGLAMKSGISRGLYSNESGLGSGGVLAAEADDDNTVMSALGAMTTAFWDTVVMCALTGVLFVSRGAKLGTDPALTVKNAFSSIPFSELFISVSMSLFVFATVIGWYYIAKRAADFVFKRTAIFDVLYVAFTFFGALMPRTPLWQSADTVNFLMLIPSLFVFIRLSGKINLYILNK